MKRNLEWYGFTAENNMQKASELLTSCGGCPSYEQAEVLKEYFHNIAVLLKREKRINNKNLTK